MAFPPSKSGLYSAPPSHPWNILPADEDHPNLTKSGTWTEVIDAAAMGASYIQSNVNGNYLELKWKGVGLWVWVIMSSDCGKVDLSIDGGAAKRIDLYSKSTRKEIIWAAVHKDKLDADGKEIEHTCRLTVTDEKNSSSSDYYVKVDGFEIETDPGALQTRAIIEAAVTAKIAEVLGRTDYIPVLEVAPPTVRYQASPADLAEGEWAALLSDIKGRGIVRPVGSQILDLLQEAATGKLIIIPHGDQSLKFKQKSTTGELQPDLISISGEPLTARDWSIDLAKLDVALSTRLADSKIANAIPQVATSNEPKIAIQKVGTTDQTARDWSSDFSKLDVALSTRLADSNVGVGGHRYQFKFASYLSQVFPKNTTTTFATISGTGYVTFMYGYKAADAVDITEIGHYVELDNIVDDFFPVIRSWLLNYYGYGSTGVKEFPAIGFTIVKTWDTTNKSYEAFAEIIPMWKFFRNSLVIKVSNSNTTTDSSGHIRVVYALFTASMITQYTVNKLYDAAELRSRLRDEGYSTSYVISEGYFGNYTLEISSEIEIPDSILSKYVAIMRKK